MILPYLHFQGDCREAMTLYQQVFGGELQLMGYDAFPGEALEGGEGRVMHGRLVTKDHGILMGSDFRDGMGDPQKAVSITVATETEAEARRLYDALGDGGDVIMPYAATFFSAGFGMMRDRFGTHWMLMAPPEAAQG
ncbi:MAG: VOC family protein [Roseivivax sp.]|nr:VOC family protein [Roseivivax sp.]